MRVNISMDKEFLELVDDYAKKMHVSRSAFIVFACYEKMKSDKAMTLFPDYLDIAKRFGMSNYLPMESTEEFKKFMDSDSSSVDPASVYSTFFGSPDDK